MKKILSFALIFVLSLTVYSTFEIKAEATEDVTITFHVHQFDGDYTNTGLGIWDGVDWNNFDDVSTDTDDFGAVITKTWPVAKINDAAFMDSIQIKPSSNGDNGDNYLAPGDGQVFLDVTSLKDGSETTLDVYYVEGSKGFYVNETGNALFFNVFANAEIAADPEALDGWGMHVWGNGASGSHPEWDTPVPYAIDMELQVGEFLVPMKLGVVELSVGAGASTGFIAHKGDTKACPDDMSFDGAALIDEVNGNKAIVSLLTNGTCEFAADYDSFISTTLAAYNENLKNRFMEAEIVTPETLTATMLTPKSIFDLAQERFAVVDGEGNEIDIASIDYGTSTVFAPVASDVVIEFQTYVRVYVKTELANVGMVGNFTDGAWDIENPVAPVGEYMGYQVFEISTNVMNFEYALVAHDKVDNETTTEVDEAAFTWDDKISGGDNLTADLLPGDSYMVVFHDDGDMLIDLDGAIDADTADYTYTSGVTCAAGQNLLTVLVDTDYPIADLGLVGSVQSPNAWTPSEAITSAVETDGGLKVFEVCLDAGAYEYKMLYNDPTQVDDPETDDDESTWDWGDAEVFTVAGGANKAADFTDMTDSAITVLYDTNIIALKDYTPTIEVTNTYRYTIYLNPGDLDITDFALVGEIQETAWDIANPLLFTEMDGAGNYYIDLAINSKDAQYLVLYNPAEDDATTTEVDESVFTWDHKISGNDNLVAGLGELSFKADMLTYTMTSEEVEGETVVTTEFNKDSLMDFTATTMTLNFADDTLMYGTDYTISYVEAYAMSDEEEDTVIEMGPLGFGLSNNFVEGDEIAATGTYAVLPTAINVILENAIAEADELGIELIDGDGNVVTVESMDLMYGMGTYTPTVTTCPENSELLTVYVMTSQDTSDLTAFGLVGTPQQSGWDATLNEGAGGYTNGGWSPDTAINPVGLDSEGNVVFEICVDNSSIDDPETADVNEAMVEGFKVLFNAEGTFSWSDTQVTPDDITFEFDGPATLFVEEGNALGSSSSYVYTLADANKLVGTGTYTLRFTDANGFVVEYPVLVDNVAPVVEFIQTADDLEINNDATSFDLMDFFSMVKFVDNQDGSLDYVVESNLDLTVPGEQNVVVTATDVWGNKGTHTFVFTVLDVIAPVITLQDGPTFDAGSDLPTWEDYATVEGGTLTISTTQVDMTNPGKFYVIYTATDEAGNTTTANLEVTINAITVDPGDVTDKLDDTGCFGSIGTGLSFIALLSVIGTAAFVVIRKR